MQRIMNKLKQKELFILIGLIVIIAFYVYRKFLLFRQLYIYSDAGWDTLTSYWPYYMFLTDSVRSGHFDFWSFKIGLGTNIFAIGTLIFDPFNLIMLLFDKYHLAYALPYIAVLKILAAGILFYFYLSLVGVSRYSAMVGSLLYAFNGYIVLWGQHYFFATIMVLAPLMMLGFELWLKKSKWFVFSIAVALIAAFGFYFLYMITIYLAIYSLFRYLSENKFELKNFIAFYLKLAGIYIIGIGLAAVLLLPAIAVTVDSPRVSGGLLKMSIFQRDNFLYYVALATRFFGSQIAINGKFHFVDWWNYYEFPVVYSGLPALILIPQLFRYTNKKNKFLYGIFIALFLLFLCFPYFSVIMTGFSAVYYRWTFIVILFMLFVTAKALDKIDREAKVDGRLLVETLIILAGFVLLAILAGGVRLGWQQKNVIAAIKSLKSVYILLSIYCGLMFMFKYRKYKNRAKVILILAVCVEMALFSSNVVNKNRSTISPQIIKQKQGYFDKTNEATDYLNKEDKSFYRVQKSKSSVMYTDPLVQNYKGTTAYSSLNQPNFQHFLQAQEVPYVDPVNTNIIGIPNERELMQTLVGVKYYLTWNKNNVPFGYSYKKSFDGIDVYQNDNYLPVGFTYDSYVSEKDYARLTPLEKDEMLLKAFVTDKDYTGLLKVTTGELKHYPPKIVKPDLKQLTTKNLTVVTNNFPDLMDIKPSNEDPLIIMPLPENISGDKVITMKIKSDHETEGQLYWRTRDADFTEGLSKKFRIEAGEKTYYVSLGNADVDFLRLDPTNSLGSITIKEFQIRVYDSDYYQKNSRYYIQDINKLKQDTLKIEKYSESYLKGSIDLDKTKMLFLSIPYDRGWSLIVDGKAVQPDKINIGFIGVPLAKGHHNIELKYVPPLLVPGGAVSIVSLAVFVILIIGKKRYFNLDNN